ncbi:Asp23/Gls24 family envelope stress response protein [Streptomyces virginiae]|uniref:Asp23/Gls24 family envelope stress response protein n=1 Tax=Streptomyces virginiae TaxID=1961 RepID=UPI002DBBFC28|nr:Asp23/Gls24 family envelope stress response protein [Streptomyces sp. CMAA1738]MEC4575766.1 Asp23/Gls24 family envelope stress response protein [Streptomyces sp. CMAA1738]
MAMNTPHPDDPREDEGLELLACGRDLATVWERAGQSEADPHTATCAYCRQAVAEMEHLRAAALPPATTPSADIDSAAVVRRVMDAVRLELRPGRNLPLGAADETSWIYESVAARTLRTAAQEVPGVLAGSCRITPPGSRTSPARGPVTVRLDITVAHGLDLRATARSVRESLARTAQDRLGLAVSELHVTVTDLHAPHDQSQEARP